MYIEIEEKCKSKKSSLYLNYCDCYIFFFTRPTPTSLDAGAMNPTAHMAAHIAMLNLYAQMTIKVKHILVMFHIS